MESSTLLNLVVNATWTQLIAPIAVITLVTGLCLVYGLHYLATSFKISRRLGQLTEQIKSIGQSAPAQRRHMLEQLFKGNACEHAWREYAETLHNQYEPHEGEQRLVRSRATASANGFFTAQNMVETPLVTEFYKHLPGILTGIGIVGTFFGLMLGLSGFRADDPSRINDSVQALLGDVFFAFVGSSFSIVASILVTLSEKWRLGRCYQSLEGFTESIDGLFDSGVGEEYLAELVKSSSESSIQTRQLKDSLVTDLREMLQNLVDTQVRENLKLADTLSTSYRDSGLMLAQQIGTSIEAGLKSPLEAIAGAVQSASGEQSHQVQGLLTDVLTAFMSKLESTFGQQFNGLHEMLGQSVTAMQAMQQGFNGLLQDMRAAGEHSVENSTKMIAQLLADMQAGQNSMQAGMNEMLANLQASIARIGSEGEGAGERMAKQLEKLFAESEARQQAMTENLQAFVDSLQQSMGQGQQATMEKISATVDVLGEQVASLFKQFEHSREQMEQASQAAQGELHRGTREMMGGLEQQVETLLVAVAEQNGTLNETLSLISSQTEQHLQSMQQGADKMRLAAERFDSAGQSVSKAGEATVGVFEAMQSTSGELIGASRELTSVVADYRNNREAISQTLTVLQGVAAGAHGEAQGRNQYLQDLKLQSEQLKALNREVHDYLEQISSVLGQGFADFSEGVDRSLKQTLGTLDDELHKAMSSLAGGVDSVRENLEELNDIFERIPRRA